MTVESDHVYYVGEFTALVHNTYPNGQPNCGNDLPARLKRAKSFASELAHLSRDALKAMTNQKGPAAQKAKQMLKLLNSIKRLMSKGGDL